MNLQLNEEQVEVLLESLRHTLSVTSFQALAVAVSDLSDEVKRQRGEIDRMTVEGRPNSWGDHIVTLDMPAGDIIRVAVPAESWGYEYRAACGPEPCGLNLVTRGHYT